ncbi:MAG: hypothetical protein WA771_11425 [Chthoniobacterales bacterium]
MKLLFTALGAALAGLAWTQAADQTANFSPITLTNNLPYTVALAEHDMGGATVPTLQGFADGQIDNEWVVLAGRTNGLHDFTNDGLINFPPAAQNRTIWVIDPVSKQTWSRDLDDATSGLSAAQIDSLSTTAPQVAQQGDTLYVIGGYGYDTGLAAFQTYPTLTALNLPDVISWVKTGSPTLASTVLQTTDEFLRVTGGELFLLGGRAQLVFGQDFAGGYTPGSNGDYTKQVRTFQINLSAGSVSISLPSAEAPRPEYRRRDLNVVPIMQGSAALGYDTGLVALSGVFTPSFGIWTVPVEITANGATYMANPLDAGTFRQGMNSYRSASISLFSPSLDQTQNLLLGGISVQYFDSATGMIATDPNIPFINGITAVIRDGNGNYSQTYLGEFPSIPNPANGNAPFLLGAEADFFPLPGISDFGNGVLNADAITTPTTIGYIYGGIIAEQPNRGNTAASNLIFSVTLSPVASPTPAPVAPPTIVVYGNRTRKTGTASRKIQGSSGGSANAIQWRVNTRSWRTQAVRADGQWKFDARNLRDGKNKVRVRAINAAGAATAVKTLTVTRN